MPGHTGGGATPLDRLRAHLDEVALVCPECGYEDADGAWRATTTGGRVEYVRRCPSCTAVHTRTVWFQHTSEP
jgi:uncharacterized Zn finger protein